MAWQYTPYVLPLLVSAAITGISGFALLARRATPGVRPFALILLSACLWSLFYAVEISSVTLQAKLIYEIIEFVGIASIPVVWVVFAMEFTGRTSKTPARFIALISLIPAATIVLLATNPYHHLAWITVRLSQDAPFPYLVHTWGIWFWIFVVYYFSLLVVGSSDLIQGQVQNAGLYSRQVVQLIAGILVPFIGFVYYGLSLGPIPYFDLAPILFSLTVIFLIWGVLRLWLFDLVPIARSSVIEEMDDGILVLNEQDRVVDINQSAAGILAVKPEDLIGKRYINALASFPNLAECCQNSGDRHFDISINGIDDTRYFDVHVTPVYDRLRNLNGRSIVLHEVTDRKRSEQELEKSHAMLLATLEATADGIMVIDGRGKLARYNRKFTELWKIPENILSSQDEQAIVAFILDQLNNPAAFYRMMNRLSLHPETESFDELDLKDGRVFERYSRPQKIGEQRVGRVWSFHDITQQRQAEERLKFISAHDILTGLYNRVYFEEELNRLEGSRQYPISLIIGDLDGLKDANDHYGHQAGDALLRKSADILRQACRTEDVVARIGGDEFAIVLPKSNALVAEAAVRRVEQANATVQVADTLLPVSMSLGAATCSAGESLRLMLRQADKQMYQRKRAKRQKRALES